MRMAVIVVILVCVTSGAVGDAVQTSDEEISYPPRQRSTTLNDIKNSYDSLAQSFKDFENTITSDIVKEHNIRRSLTVHRKFFGSLFVYGLLSLLYFRHKSKK